MSGFGAQIQKRLNELRKAEQNIPKIIDEVAEAATIEAVQRAQERTPPNVGGLAGTNTREGRLARSWVTDSITKPTKGTTELRNNMQYASYVDQGHRMDKHFVPGLIVNGSRLEKSPDGSGGIMVGTKTAYVPGFYMVRAAKGKWKTTVRTMLQNKVREVLK